MDVAKSFARVCLTRGLVGIAGRRVYSKERSLFGGSSLSIFQCVCVPWEVRAGVLTYVMCAILGSPEGCQSYFTSHAAFVFRLLTHSTARSPHVVKEACFVLHAAVRSDTCCTSDAERLLCYIFRKLPL